MKTAARVLVALISALATYYFVFWVGGALLFRDGLSASVSGFISLALACLVGWFIWTQTAKPPPSLGKAIVLGAIVTGGIGFSAGFFGPIIFMPNANQGPLLGIFITGPLGFLVGAVGGAIYWFTRPHRDDDRINNGAS